MGVVIFYPELSRELGSIEAAIYYQYLHFWSDKGSRPDGFIYKSKKEIEEDTTLSRFQQDSARKILEEKGWIETKLLKANKAPTLHYKCLVDVKVSISKKLTNRLVRNSLILDKQETRYSITDITTENTTKAFPKENAFDSSKPIIEIREDAEGKEVIRKKRDTEVLKLREKLYDMFEKSYGVRPLPHHGDSKNIQTALTRLTPEKIIELVESQLDYKNPITVRNALRNDTITEYLQTNY